MSESTKIQWTDKTFNPWIGCTKIAPECDNCYAANQDNFRKWTPEGWGAGKPRKRTKTWGDPVKWNREAARLGVRHKVFCASLADVFDKEVPDAWRSDLFDLIGVTPHLDWQVLTKRPGYALHLLGDAETHPANVWLGTSVGTVGRLPQTRLLACIPAAVRFLSVEPLLEDLGAIDLAGIQWVIVGGESGPGARPCDVEWIRSIIEQCKAASVPVFVKQLGARAVTFDCGIGDAYENGWPSGSRIHVGRTLDDPRWVQFRDHKGGNPDEWPADLRIREFPNQRTF